MIESFLPVIGKKEGYIYRNASIALCNGIADFAYVKLKGRSYNLFILLDTGFKNR